MKRIMVISPSIGTLQFSLHGTAETVRSRGHLISGILPAIKANASLYFSISRLRIFAMNDRKPHHLTEGQILALEVAENEKKSQSAKRFFRRAILVIGLAMLGYWVWLTTVVYWDAGPVR